MTLKCYTVISLFLCQSGISIFNSVQYIRQFTSLGFCIILIGFCFLPGRKFTPGSHPIKYLKFEIFRGELSSHHRGTEIGCLINRGSLLPERELAEYTFFEKNDYPCSFLCENQKILLPKLNRIVTNIHCNNEQKLLRDTV